MKDILNKIVSPDRPIEHRIDLDLLQQYTRRSSTFTTPIQWQNVKHLHLLGIREYRKVGVRKGNYLDNKGEWVLSAGVDALDILLLLTRCGTSLEVLSIASIDLEQLDVHKLTGLKELYLSESDCLTTILGLENLSALEILNLDFTSVKSLSLTKPLTKLTCFDAAYTPLKDTSFLTMLPNVRKLWFNGASVSALPSLKGLSNLELLLLSRTKISTLDGVAIPKQLERLYLDNTDISRLPDTIRQLPNLTFLNLSGLKLKELPDWLPNLGLTIGRDSGFGINLKNTEVEGVDMSIFDQSQEVIRAWFNERKKAISGGPLNEIKVVFLGDGSTGKSLTVARLMEEEVGTKPKKFDGEATPGIAIEDRDFPLPDGRNVQVHFWDFGGQEILHSMHRIFLTDRTLYVVMINARNNTQDDQARYWLHNVSSFAPGCPVLLVLNQVDQNPNASINERSLRRLYPNLRQVIRLSALTYDQETFNNAFTVPMLTEVATFESLGAFFPPAWKAIMDQVRGIEGNFIRGNAFYKICNDSGVDDRKVCLGLLKWFHDIGVSFCCSGSARLRDYVVLKPEWITNAIYTILWNKRSDATNGMVDREEIYRLLTPEEGAGIKQVRSDMTYTLEDVDYVLSITRQFRLSFPLDSDQEFIPMLCNANALPEADAFLEEPNVIEFRMEYDYLPSNVLHRLMVDMRQDLITNKVWLTGALFRNKHNGVRALVKSEGNVLSIHIRATDPEHRAHTYLNTLRGVLDAIHMDMGLKPPEVLVAYTQDDQTEYFPYEMLEGARKNGQATQYSRLFHRMIPISDILNGTDSWVAEQNEKLLRDLASICIQLLSNRNMHNVHEDDRNDILRNALRNKGYHVSDQTHVGIGKTGRRAGSLDLQLLHEDNLPWTNLEAMNLHAYTESQVAYWNDHLKRLMDNYDPSGLPTLFLVSYVNCSADTYHKLFSAYTEHMRTYAPSKSEVRQGTLTEVLPLGEQRTYLRVTRCTYDRAGTPVTVYHYFVGFTGEIIA